MVVLAPHLLVRKGELDAITPLMVIYRNNQFVLMLERISLLSNAVS